LFLLNQVKDLSVEQLNRVPPGFNNNIIWNLGHLISAQQNVCYVKTGLTPVADENLISLYLSGSKPEAGVNEADIKIIKDIFISSIDHLQTDINRQAFRNYTPALMIQKVYGVQVNNIEDALEYLLYHEGLHAAVINTLQRFI